MFDSMSRLVRKALLATVLAAGCMTASAADFFWTGNTYGRGVGAVPASTCGSKQMQDGLCYEPCRGGYNGKGPVCWLDSEASYGRGVGVAQELHSGKLRCPGDHPDKQASLCYRSCRDGYHGEGPVCYNNQSASYGRGAGTVPGQACGSGQQLDGGLCYQACRSGYRGEGPVCWANPPQGMVVCGAGFAKDDKTCAFIIAGQTSSVLTLFANAASSGAFEELKKSTKAKLSKTQLESLEKIFASSQKYMAQLKNLAKPLESKNPSTFSRVVSQMGEIVTDPEFRKLLSDSYKIYSVAGSDPKYIEDEFRNFATLMSIFDPSGVFDVVAAYMYPSIK